MGWQDDPSVGPAVGLATSPQASGSSGSWLDDPSAGLPKEDSEGLDRYFAIEHNPAAAMNGEAWHPSGKRFPLTGGERLAASLAYHRDKPQDAGKYIVNRLPFGAGAAWSAADAINVRGAVKRIEEDKATGADYNLVGEFLTSTARSNENWEGVKNLEPSEMGMFAADLASHLPGFAVDFITSGPVFAGGKKVAEKAAFEGIKGLLGKAAYRSAFRSLAGRGAIKGAVGTAGFTAGAAAQSVAPTMIAGAAPKVAERMIDTLSIEQGDDGRLRAYVPDDMQGDSFLAALPKGLGDHYTEVLSEHTGRLLPFLGKAAKGQAAKWLPASVRSAYARAAGSRLLAGLKEGDQGLLKSLKAAGQAAGYQGMLGESFEERVKEGLDYGLGISPNAGALGELAGGNFRAAAGQVGSELAGFAGFPAAGAAVRGAARFMPPEIQAELRKSLDALGSTPSRDAWAAAGLPGGTSARERAEYVAKMGAALDEHNRLRIEAGKQAEEDALPLGEDPGLGTLDDVEYPPGIEIDETQPLDSDETGTLDDVAADPFTVPRTAQPAELTSTPSRYAGMPHSQLDQIAKSRGLTDWNKGWPMGRKVASLEKPQNATESLPAVQTPSEPPLAVEATPRATEKRIEPITPDAESVAPAAEQVPTVGVELAEPPPRVYSGKVPEMLFHGTRYSGNIVAGKGKSIASQGIWLTNEGRAKEFAEGRPSQEGKSPRVVGYKPNFKKTAYISNDTALHSTSDDLIKQGFDSAFIMDTGFFVALTEDAVTPTQAQTPEVQQGNIVSPSRLERIRQALDEEFAQPAPAQEAQQPAPPKRLEPAKPQAKKEMKPRKPRNADIIKQAGITLNKTPKGWHVSGISKEQGDVLRADYGGRRTATGYHVKSDPTQSLLDAAREIAEEAQKSDAAARSGLVRTRIGTLAPEAAEYYEQQRAERIALAQDRVAERNAGVNDLLAGEAFAESDEAIEAEVDNELAAELLADNPEIDELSESEDEADTSFDFGANENQGPTAQEISDAVAAEIAARKPPLKKSEQAAERKAAAKQRFMEAGRRLIDPSQVFVGLDPAKVRDAVDMVLAAVDYGVASFQEFVALAQENFGRQSVLEMAPYLEEAARQAGIENVTSVEAVFEQDNPAEPNMPEQAAEAPMLLTGDELTSIKKAVVNDLRQMVGLPEMEGSTPQTVEGWAEQARATLAADPKAAIRLVNELAGKTARPISQHDAMLLQFRYRQLANELKPAVDAYFEAVATGDPVAIAAARTDVLNARKAMTDFEETIHPSKETWGRTGVALQQMMRADYSLEAVLRRGQEANHGAELNPEQTAELTKLAGQLADLQAKFDEVRRRNDDMQAELFSKEQHAKAVESGRRKLQPRSERRAAAEKKVADAWAKFQQATVGRLGAGIPVDLLAPAAEVAKAYIELGYVRFGEFMAAVRQNAGKGADENLFRQAWDQAAAEAGLAATELDLADRAELTQAAREIQRHLIENGLTEREQVIDAVHEILQQEAPGLTRRQTMDALSRYGQFQRQSQGEVEKLIREMNSEILKLSQIDQLEIAVKRIDELRAQGQTDEQIGETLNKEKLLVEATGLLRDKPGQAVRQLTQKYNELKKSIPATAAGKAGFLQTAVAAIERALANRIADLNWEISNNERIVKEKRERPTTERIKELEAERDALLKTHREMFPPQKKKATAEQRVAAAIRGADKAIERLEQQLKDKDFDPLHREPLSSPELDARRSRLKQLRAARDAAKAAELARWEDEGGSVPLGKVPLSKEEIARRIYESSLRKRIADYQRILVEEDFAPKLKKQARTLSDSELALKRQMEDVRHKVLEKYAEYHLKHLHGIAWAADKIAEAAHLSRALMTSFDLSSLMRQGGLAAMGHPLLAKQALVETIAAIAHTYDSTNAKALIGGVTLENAQKFLRTIDSRQAEFAFMHKLTEGPAGELRLRAGLDLPSSDQKITRQEEAFQGRWGKHVPGVAVSSRLYTMILNKLRADLFDSMVQNLGRGGQVTMEEAKIIASFVNVATGRSDLGRLNGWAATLNTVFFAPRYVASRFQYLAMPFYLPFQGGIKSNWRVKQAILKEYGRTATGIATVLGAFSLLGMLLYDPDDDDRPRVNFDPRSSDFLKVRMGETRLDFLSGLSQAIVLSSRMASGQTANADGTVKNLGEGYKPQTRLSVLGRFGRTKLAPVPGLVATVADDWTNVVGQKETPLSLGAGLVTPLSLEDAATTMQAQGIPKGAAFSTLSLLGVGMSTYGPKTEYVTGTAAERKAQIEKDLERMAWDDPEKPAYSEYLNDEQLAKFSERRRQKRASVIWEALHEPDRKSHKSDETYQESVAQRDENQKRLEAMKAEGVDVDDAMDLLKSHPDAKGKQGYTPSYFKKRRALRMLYEQNARRVGAALAQSAG